MPDYCDNIVTVTGDPAALDAVAAACAGPRGPLDFDRLVPVPVQLRPAPPIEGPVHRALRAALNRPPPTLDLPPAAREWCLDHWGSRWQAEDVRVERSPSALRYTFSTVHSAAEPVSRRISQLRPDVDVHHASSDAASDWAGYVLYRGGLVVDRLAASWQQLWHPYGRPDRAPEDTDERYEARLDAWLDTEPGFPPQVRHHP